MRTHTRGAAEPKRRCCRCCGSGTETKGWRCSTWRTESEGCSRRGCPKTATKGRSSTCACSERTKATWCGCWPGTAKSEATRRLPASEREHGCASRPTDNKRSRPWKSKSSREIGRGKKIHKGSFHPLVQRACVIPGVSPCHPSQGTPCQMRPGHGEHSSVLRVEPSETLTSEPLALLEGILVGHVWQSSFLYGCAFCMHPFRTSANVPVAFSPNDSPTRTRCSPKSKRGQCFKCLKMCWVHEHIPPMPFAFLATNNALKKKCASAWTSSSFSFGVRHVMLMMLKDMHMLTAEGREGINPQERRDGHRTRYEARDHAHPVVWFMTPDETQDSFFQTQVSSPSSSRQTSLMHALRIIFLQGMSWQDARERPIGMHNVSIFVRITCAFSWLITLSLFTLPCEKDLCRHIPSCMCVSVCVWSFSNECMNSSSIPRQNALSFTPKWLKKKFRCCQIDFLHAKNLTHTENMTNSHIGLQHLLPMN
jgi:hypothetical protein